MYKSRKIIKTLSWSDLPRKSTSREIGQVVQEIEKNSNVSILVLIQYSVS